MNGIKYRSAEEMKDSGIEWINKIPETWQYLKIKHSSSGEMNSFTDGDWIESEYITEDGVRLVQTGNIGIGHYKEQGFRYISEKSFRSLNCKAIRPDTILICRLADPVGRACLVPSFNEKTITSVDVCMLTVGRVLINKYLVYIFSTQGYLEHAEMIARGGTRQRISRTQLGEIKYPLAPLSEQRKIANFLDIKTAQFDSIIAKKEQLIAKLEEAKKSLISEVVTGKVKIVDGQLVPRQPEEMKDSGVEWLGMIPKEWALIKLKWFVKTTSGITPLTSDYDRYYDGEINWIRSTDLNNSELFESEVKIKVNATRKYGMKLLPKGTILIAMYGGAGTIGKNSILRCESTINQAVCAIYPNQKYTPDYTFFYVNFFRPYWMIEAKGTRVDPNISQDIVRNLILPKIDTNEQKVIVTVLQCKTENLLRLIQTENNIISLLKSAKKSLISEAVTGKIDLRDWEIIEQGGAS